MAQGDPPDFPLVVAGNCGDRVAISSPSWPKGATQVVELLKLKKHHERADALLLAEYLRRQSQVSAVV